MKTVSLRLPDALASKLSALARKQRTSKSALVRDALEAYLTNGTGARQRTSLADRAKGLLGSLEGPGDLSYNKEHMRDFGR